MIRPSKESVRFEKIKNIPWKLSQWTWLFLQLGGFWSVFMFYPKCAKIFYYYLTTYGFQNAEFYDLLLALPSFIFWFFTTVFMCCFVIEMFVSKKVKKSLLTWLRKSTSFFAFLGYVVAVVFVFISPKEMALHVWEIYVCFAIFVHAVVSWREGRLKRSEGCND